MKRQQDFDGVYSNGKQTFDLLNLNTKAEMEGIKAICKGSQNGTDVYYATPAGTIIHRYTYNDLEDWFADIGAIYSERRGYEILGRKFKKIKDKGEPDEELIKFLEFSNTQEYYY